MNRRPLKRFLVVFLLVLIVAGQALPIQAKSTKPSAAGYFRMLSPGQAGNRTEIDCWSLIHYSSWEPRPGNVWANNTYAPQPLTLEDFPAWDDSWNTFYKPRITGNFSGTTDEIIQWVACKWGISDNLLRAWAYIESNWKQPKLGAYLPITWGLCVPGHMADSCPTAFGILQTVWYYHPFGQEPFGAWPWIEKSTAFTLDLAAAEFRGCYDGLSAYMGPTAGDVWGCIASWRTRTYKPGGGSYAARVKMANQTRPWLKW